MVMLEEVLEREEFSDGKINYRINSERLDSRHSLCYYAGEILHAIERDIKNIRQKNQESEVYFFTLRNQTH